MIRQAKYLLLTTCALVLVVLIIQLTDYNITRFRLALSHWYLQNTPVNVSSTSIANTPRLVTAAPVHNPVPPDYVLQQMSNTELQIFYQSYVNSPQTTCSRVERMGHIMDGGWEICDDPLYRPPKGDCLLYSYGINNDFSYDDDMAAYGCEVHSFDPSMKTAPHIRGDSVFFHPTGVGGKNGTSKEEWQLYTVGSHRRLLQHAPEQRRLGILKMDVEGSELESLMTALDEGSLSDVRQLTFETHVAWGNFDPTKEQYMTFLALLRKAYEKGFRIYLTHRNLGAVFDSKLEKGKRRVYCHEIHTVNINFKNHVNADGSIVGDGMVSNSTRQERYNEQTQLILQERELYFKKFPEKDKQRLNISNIFNVQTPYSSSLQFLVLPPGVRG